MKTYDEVDVYIYSFLTLDTSWNWASRPCCLIKWERFVGTDWRGEGWVDPRTGVGDVKKRKIFALPGLEFRPLCRPARSQSLYWLSYGGFIMTVGNTVNASGLKRPSRTASSGLSAIHHEEIISSGM
jgi:hypothetical protein